MSEMRPLPTVVALQPRAGHVLHNLVQARGAHALLLTGSAGAGTTAAAEWIAQQVIAPLGSRDADHALHRVERRTHPDLSWVSAEGNSLTIDQMRGVVERASRTPFEASAQVVVIENADSLSFDNVNAGNALLTSLEEPAGAMVFVLLAERAERILGTIRSRTIEIPFVPLPDAVIIDVLQDEGVSAASLAAHGLDLQSVARIARGNITRARELAAGGQTAIRRATMLAVAIGLSGGAMLASEATGRILGLAEAVEATVRTAADAEFSLLLERSSKDEARALNAKSNDQGIEKRTARRVRKARTSELRACLDELAVWNRDLLAVSIGAESTIVNLDAREQLHGLVERGAARHAVAAIDSLEACALRLQFNNADVPVSIAAVCSEIAALANGRIRARRTLGASAITPAGYDLALG